MNPIDRAIVLEEAKKYTDIKQLAKVVKSYTNFQNAPFTIDFSPNPDYENLPLVIYDHPPGSPPGVEAIVWWDGVDYQDCANFNDTSINVGNMGIIGIGEDTGEPFAIIIDYDQDIMLICAAQQGKHEFNIRVGYETIVPIDPKLLPGVCLPVVELSTPPADPNAEEPNDLTAEECNAMNAVLATSKYVLLTYKKDSLGLFPITIILSFITIEGLEGYMGFAPTETGLWFPCIIAKIGDVWQFRFANLQ